MGTKATRLSSENPQQSSKKVYLEALRYFAIFFVIYNHTAGNGFLLFVDSEQPQWLYPLNLFISQIDKIAVPIFFMISGSLLLSKEEPISVILKKRALKMTLVLLGISLFYLFYNDISLTQSTVKGSELVTDPAMSDPTLKDILARSGALKDIVLKDPTVTDPTAKDVTLIGFFNLIYNQELSPQLWYLYSYIGALLMLPFIRKIANQLTYKESIYLLVCHLLFVGIIPSAIYLINGSFIGRISHFTIPIITERNIFYMLMGYFLEHLMPKEKYNGKSAIVAVVLFFVFGAMDSYVSHLLIEDLKEAGRENTFSYNLFACLVAVPAMSVFFLAKYFFTKARTPKLLEKIIVACGSSVFGIYLLEAFLRRETYEVFVALNRSLPKVVACSIWVFVCMLLGTVITLILKRIPILRKLL